MLRGVSVTTTYRVCARVSALSGSGFGAEGETREVVGLGVALLGDEAWEERTMELEAGSVVGAIERAEERLTREGKPFQVCAVLPLTTWKHHKAPGTATGPTIPHASYLGASDIGAVVGLSPYANALDVWASKLGKTSFAGNMRTRAGQALERAILDLYTDEHPEVGPLRFPGTLTTGDVLRSTGATPDAIDVRGRCTQVKLVGLNVAYRWLDESLGGDGIPAEFLAQIHYEAWHAAQILGEPMTEGRAVAQIGTEQRVYTVKIDVEFAELLVDEGRRFWRDHVVTGVMPIVTEPSVDTLRAIFARPSVPWARMTDGELALAREYAEARDAETWWGKEKDRVGAKLCEAMALRQCIATGTGKHDTKVTWNPEKGRVSWKDVAKHLGATDALAEKFRGPDTRTLRVAVKG
jgi:hypothetical protein